MKQDKKVYRAREISKIFGVVLSTVWHYVKQWKLHSIKVSDNVTVFRADEVHSLFGVKA